MRRSTHPQWCVEHGARSDSAQPQWTVPRQRYLDLLGDTGVADLSPLRRTSVTRLTISLGVCGRVQDVSALSEVQKLEKLRIEGDDRLPRRLADATGVETPDDSIDPWPPAKVLEILERWIACAGELPALNLSRLSVAYVDLVDRCPKLEALNVLYCKGLDDVSFVTALPRLKTLRLRGTRVRNLSPLGRCQTLEVLDLGSCPEVTDLSPLSRCQALTALDLTQCSGVRDLSPLTACRALATLNLSWCSNVRDLSPLVGMVSLRELTIDHSEPARDLAPLAECRKLAVLKVTHRHGDPDFDLSVLSRIPALTDLTVGPDDTVDRHTSSEFIVPKLPPRLTRLRLVGQYESDVVGAGELLRLVELEHLDVAKCPQIPEFLAVCATGMTGFPCSGDDVRTPEWYARILRGLQTNTPTITTLDLAALRWVEPELLVHLQDLEQLTLPRYGTHDLAPLRGLRGLRRLTVSAPRHLDRLLQLAGLETLTHLTFHPGGRLSWVVPDCLRVPLGLSDCRSIEEASPQETVALLRVLRTRCLATTALDLSAQKIDFLETVALFENLTSLNLDGCSPAHESWSGGEFRFDHLGFLARLTRLTDLRLDTNAASPEQIADLARALPNCEIHVCP